MGDFPGLISGLDQAEARGRENAALYVGFFRRWREAGFDDDLCERMTLNYMDGEMGRPVLIQEGFDDDADGVDT